MDQLLPHLYITDSSLERYQVSRNSDRIVFLTHAIMILEMCDVRSEENSSDLHTVEPNSGNQILIQ